MWNHFVEMSAILLSMLLLCSLKADAKIVDLTHYINDNATMVHPAFGEFRLDVKQHGWIDLQNGGKAWYGY